MPTRRGRSSGSRGPTAASPSGRTPSSTRVTARVASAAREARCRPRRGGAPGTHQLTDVRGRVDRGRSGSARGSCRPTRWPPRPSSPTTSPAPTRQSASAPPTGPATYRDAFDAGPVVFEVDEADVDLAVAWPTGPRAAGTGHRPLARGGDVHQRHHRATQGRRDHPGQLRVRRHDDGRRGRAHPTTASSWCCRCSTPTRSTTRSPRRSSSVRPWP
jgi:hypothetical protein